MSKEPAFPIYINEIADRVTVQWWDGLPLGVFSIDGFKALLDEGMTIMRDTYGEDNWGLDGWTKREDN